MTALLPAPAPVPLLPAVCPVCRRMATPLGLVTRAMLGGCDVAITTGQGTFVPVGEGLVGEALAMVDERENERIAA